MPVLNVDMAGEQLLRIFIPNTNNPNTKQFQISKIQITRTAFGGGQNIAIKQYSDD